MIAELLGVPRKDWETLFRWTNEILGGGDPEFRRAGEDRISASFEAVRVFLSARVKLGSVSRLLRLNAGSRLPMS